MNTVQRNNNIIRKQVQELFKNNNEKFDINEKFDYKW